MQSLDLLTHQGGFFISWQAYTVAFLVSAVIGAVALWLVLRLLYKGYFRIFAVYVVALAVFVLIYQPTFDEDAVVDQLPVEEEQGAGEAAPDRVAE